MRYYFKSKTMTGFKFKQFEIHQDRCAMKVGTDGVLLGAWAPGGKRILDVGSGTGLISLMMAQRFPEAQVLGIDMDGEACEEAAENVAASPFADRVEIECCRLQDYHSAESFDAIVSNPPFFLNSLKNPDSKRTMARHTDSLPFRDLFRECGVKTVERKQPKRYLLSFAKHRYNGMENTLKTMTDSEGNRSEWYAKITEEFYVR